MSHVLVIGGGAAGMIAAIRAAQNGHRVCVLERNEKCGKKLYITGKGRCNITNAAAQDMFLSSVVRNGRFLYSSFHAFDNAGLMQYMESIGVPLEVQRGQRVFPKSQKSSDVIRALVREMDNSGVMVRLSSRVRKLLIQDGRVCGAELYSGERIKADAVVLATGGRSYPATGSTGDGYALAKQAGHNVSETYPALTPLHTKQQWPGRLAGLTLKNVGLSAIQRQKKLFNRQGELLFTHTGISGPLALCLSSMAAGMALGDIEVYIDIKAALDHETLDKRLQKELAQGGKKSVKNMLPALMPGSMAPIVLELMGWDDALRCDGVTQPMRRALGSLLKAFRLDISAMGGWEEAIITRGGVNVKEVSPQSMESRVMPGLYICGELLDVDALTGGFNLQIAFSTGFAAGSAIK